MASLVNFDQNGALGPALWLIYNSPCLNSAGISKLTSLVKENFERLSNRTTEGDKEFCAQMCEYNLLQCPMTTTQILATKFFQSMQAKDVDFDCHRKMLEQIVPFNMKSAKAHIPQLDLDDMNLKAWAARFMECWMTEGQIQKHCEVRGENAEDFMKQRQILGSDLAKAIKTGNFSENDFDLLIATTRMVLQTMKSADHNNEALCLSGRYLELFAQIKDNPQNGGEEILGLLDSIFRKKMFPKSVPAAAAIAPK